MQETFSCVLFEWTNFNNKRKKNCYYCERQWETKEEDWSVKVDRLKPKKTKTIKEITQKNTKTLSFIRSCWWQSWD